MLFISVATFFLRAFDKDVTNMAPEAGEMPKVKLEAPFCLSHECYAGFFMPLLHVCSKSFLFFL